ncbi:hypothetical protein, partial [Curtobacterium sp. B18]|uniref:hypothetical protein n=1 Tax=Curtobacterium sp. B18 TaxID=95614 RepID=UPI0005B2D0BA
MDNAWLVPLSMLLGGVFGAGVVVLIITPTDLGSRCGRALGRRLARRALLRSVLLRSVLRGRWRIGVGLTVAVRVVVERVVVHRDVRGADRAARGGAV